MCDLILKSPDSSIGGCLKYEYEIRFGPSYYSLHIQNLGHLKSRIFGKTFLWSPNSRYLVVQEWMTTSESDYPWTRLLLIDFQTGLGKWLAGVKGGWIRPVKFEDGKIIYEKDLSTTMSTITEYELEIKSLDHWENLEWV